MRPILARISSAASGFFFCGMIEEPVEKRSDMVTKRNWAEDQITSSSASRDRWTAQIAALASAGCEIARVAVPKKEDARALPLIVRLSPVPVIADIHFNASLALDAIDAGVAAVRINPGNIGGPDKTEQVVRAAKRAGIPMRIGANAGSLPKHLEALAREDAAEALVVEALEQVEILTGVKPTSPWPTAATAALRRLKAYGC